MYGAGLLLQDAQGPPGDTEDGGKPGGKDAGGDDEDDEGDLFAEDDGVASGAGQVPIDGAAEAPEHDDRRDARQAEGFRKANTGLSDMYDDSQGYYNFRVGELMGGRCGPRCRSTAASLLVVGDRQPVLFLMKDEHAAMSLRGAGSA